MPTHRLLVLAGLTYAELARLRRLVPAPPRRRGRPCTGPPLRRVVVACAALRTNLTVRELAAVVGLSKSTVPGNRNDPVDFRGSTVEALCLRHRRVIADGGYRGVPGLRIPVFAHNRIVRDRAWRRHRRRRARVEHAIARLKNWRILRDHRRRGRHLAHTVAAIAFLHNLKLEFRDSA